MNRMERALRELGEMDTLSEADSPIHRLNPAAKLITVIAFIVTVLSFGKYDLRGLVPFILGPVLCYQLSGIPVRLCFYRMRFVLPLVMAVGLFNPLFDRQIVLRIGSAGISGGTISMLCLMLKGVLCLMASFLLVATTPFDSLCGALRKMHVPKTLVTLLLLTYRYVGVMTRELAVMTEAYALRAPGQKGIHISAWGSFLGQLLLRSMDRAQELYASMLLRGYHHHFHYAPEKPFGRWDLVFLLGSIVLFLLFRRVDIAYLLGRLITG